MDSFLGGAVNFGSSVPTYGDIGSGYSGDFFGGSSPNTGMGIGSSILQGLGRGALGSLTGGFGGASVGGAPGYSQGGPYTNQTRNDIQNLMALAFKSFTDPKSTI